MIELLAALAAIYSTPTSPVYDKIPHIFHGQWRSKGSKCYSGEPGSLFVGPNAMAIEIVDRNEQDDIEFTAHKVRVINNRQVILNGLWHQNTYDFGTVTVRLKVFSNNKIITIQAPGWMGKFERCAKI